MDAKYYLERHITRYNEQWYCYLCKLANLTDAKYHLQEVHPDICIILISDFSHNLSNEKCKKLLNHGITIKNILDERCNTKYFCIPCKSWISSLINVDEHLKGKKHRTCISSKPKLFNCGIITQDVLQNCRIFLYAEYFCIFCNCSIPTLDHVNEHLEGKKHQICKNDIKPKLLNHGIIMRDLSQNCDVKYFCVPCNCSISALRHINKHLQEKKHQRYISSIKSNISNKQQHSNENISNNVSVNVKTQMEHINKSKFLAEIQPVCENKLTNDNSINGHKIKEEEESITSSESYQKDSNSNNVLQVERCVNMCFCSLCDKFDNKLNMSEHAQDKRHISAISALKINQEATYIIILENDRRTIKPLQLNSRKLDGTMWPEYIKTMSNVIMCDQCKSPIKETDIINHDITIHKEYMKSSMEYISDSTLPVNSKNVNIFNYPMFKCSFCNEIIHGISKLEIHFSSPQHNKNIKLLITTKKQEYNDCRNIESFFELLEFLNIISFENNDNIIQTMEQPVMYVKNHLASFHKSSDNVAENKFSYVCIACKSKFHAIQDVIEHLSTKERHLKHFKNILLTYNHIYNVCTTKEFDINKTQAAESPTCIENISINTPEEHNINKIQTAQYIDNNSDLINANTDSKDDIFQNRENNSGLFMPDDISIEIKQFIRNIPVEKNINKIVRTKQKNNVLDRYNKMYYIRFLDFEKIMFTYNQDKLKKIESSLKLYALQNKNMLCLACDVAHSINVHILYEHIRSEQHIIQLTQLHKNSEERRLNLLKESIKVNYTNFKCYACDKNEKWVHYGESWIKEHIRYPTHKKKHKELIKNIKCMLLSEEELCSLWYNIQYFACVECNARFKIKIEFMEHLYQKHKNVIVKNSSKIVQNSFDFCITCATLWYKNLSRCEQSVYQRHCRKRTHQYLTKSNDFAIMSLPQSLQELLKNTNKTVAHLFKSSNDALNDERTIQLVDDLKNTFKTQQFDVEVYMFGSRVTGLASSESDVDIYLNFGDECIEAELIKNKSKQIQNCLNTDSQNWEIEFISNKSRTPIVRLRHRPTRLQCDISFTNGLSVENSKLINSFNTAYPPCRQLILFLKKWMLLGNLTGSSFGITSYALTWLVIFYLQVAYKIPSIATLIKSHNRSKIVSGWETGVGNNVPIDVPELPELPELLLGFFEYYGRFDYMNDVVCPLLGITCHKKIFTKISDLPDTMALYIAQMQKAKPEYFRVDSSMCVQDPFDLSHNLTKAVPILTLKRFKQYCKESALMLRMFIDKKIII